jgi:DNA processing protein
VTEPEDVVSALAPMLREAPSPVFTAEPSATADAGIPPHRAGQPPAVADADREKLLGALGPAPVDVDELGRATGLSPRAIQIAQLELTLAGRVERHGHQLVSRKA